MCGIVGVWDRRHPVGAEALMKMADRLTHRGPDDGGVWQDTQIGLGLAHRRLSILDLSVAGHQPMTSAAGRYVMSYNGEIYNVSALRDELDRTLPSPQWRGHSDTEVMLAGFDRWGIRETLARSNGMFALAVFDRESRVLTLARDRLGEKPLYFGQVGQRLCFASELKAFAAMEGWQPRIDAEVASQFLRQGYVGGPRSLVAGIYRLPPGCLLELRASDVESARDWPAFADRLVPFWSLGPAAQAARTAACKSEPEARERFEALMQDSIALRMVADVPVGAFLSGGIDSSAVVSLMQRLSSRPVRTFSIGFTEERFNEAPYAAAVARHLHTDHTELYVTPEDALAVIPELPVIYDEPFADDSQIPTVLLTRMAGKHVKVALSGDGGDELFAGYKRYGKILRLWEQTRRVPAGLRSSLAACTRTTARMIEPFARESGDGKSSAYRLARLAERLQAHSVDEMRQRYMAGLPATGILQPAAGPGLAAHCVAPEWMQDPLDRLLYADQRDYLPDDILVKVDRAAMASSLETRIPLLDHRIVEFAWSLPREMVLGPQGTKLPLRRLLDRYVPGALVDRPKRGFSIPLAAWLRGPLRPWAESLLDSAQLRSAGLWDTAQIKTSWQTHLSGRKDLSASFWRVLMLAAWLQQTGARI